MYLDHNATTPMHPAVVDAMTAWLAGAPGNPSSVHAPGRRARAAVERARRQLSGALGASPAEVVFTSGATEALHLAVCGLVPQGGHVVASAVEHPALFGACEVAGAEVTRVPVDGRGRVRVEDFAAAVRPETRLVALMAAQNELGNLYPVADVTRAVAPVPLLCDAAQAFGKVPLELGEAALVVVSAHKLGGPQGVGALWTRATGALRPHLAGGPQERGRRAGTENVTAIIGFGVAAEHVSERLRAMGAVRALRDRAAESLSALGAELHGEPGLPNTVSFRLDGLDGDVVLQALDLDGLYLSSGSACSSGALEPSPVLRALGLHESQARGGLRLSLGPESVGAEVDALLASLERLLERRARCA